MLAAARHGVLLAEALHLSGNSTIITLNRIWNVHLLGNLVPVAVVGLDVIRVVHHNLVSLAVVRRVCIRVIAYKTTL